MHMRTIDQIKWFGFLDVHDSGRRWETVHAGQNMEGTQTCGVLAFQDSKFLMREEMRAICLAFKFEKADLGLHDTC
jgi:hypothetical protein